MTDPTTPSAMEEARTIIRAFRSTSARLSILEQAALDVALALTERHEHYRCEDCGRRRRKGSHTKEIEAQLREREREVERLREALDHMLRISFMEDEAPGERLRAIRDNIRALIPKERSQHETR